MPDPPDCHHGASLGQGRREALERQCRKTEKEVTRRCEAQGTREVISTSGSQPGPPLGTTGAQDCEEVIPRGGVSQQQPWLGLVRASLRKGCDLKHELKNARRGQSQRFLMARLRPDVMSNKGESWMVQCSLVYPFPSCYSFQLFGKHIIPPLV